MNHDVFQAIADPTRREIISLLVEEQPATINQVSSHFSMSRQAVAKHLNVLHSAEVIYIVKQGREKHISLNSAALKDVYLWVSTYKKFWNQKLDKLGEYLDAKG